MNVLELKAQIEILDRLLNRHRSNYAYTAKGIRDELKQQLQNIYNQRELNSANRIACCGNCEEELASNDDICAHCNCVLSEYDTLYKQRELNKKAKG